MSLCVSVCVPVCVSGSVSVWDSRALSLSLSLSVHVCLCLSVSVCAALNAVKNTWLGPVAAKVVPLDRRAGRFKGFKAGKRQH